MIPFTRQLGPRSGVQLNPIADNTERFVAGNADQNIAVAGRFERGRIDKAFRVNRGNLYRMLGQPSSTSVSRLNECFVHIYEALFNGTNEAVVYRLNPTSAVLSLMCAEATTVDTDVWTVDTAAPVGNLLTVKHLECFNEGVRAEINAVETLGTDLDATATVNVPLTGATPLVIGATTITAGMRVKLTAQTVGAQNGTYTCGISGTYTLTLADDEVPVATTDVVVRIRDVTTGVLLYEFTGSLDVTAKDEFGQSIYLPSVVSSLTDDVEIVVTGTSVAPDCAFYGKDVDNVDIFVGADLVYFDEDTTTYDSEDYDRACAALKYSEYDFGYIIGGGTRAVSLLSKLIALGIDINKQVAWDIPGDYTPAQAITFYNQLSIDTHYSQCFWAPLLTDDPVNGGKDYQGTSAINIGMRCARNARTDANGVAPKNYPVAGKDWALPRTGVVQKYTPTETELDDLARARINPVVFSKFNSGGKYIFSDSLTGARTEADRKLIAVADMSSQVDDWVAAYSKESLQLPMLEAVKRTTDFLKTLFEGIETAKWIKPSKELGDRSFVATVQPNAQRPSDRMDVAYWLHYDGTVRAIYIQQTLSK